MGKLLEAIKTGNANGAISSIQETLRKKTLSLVTEEHKRVASFVFDEAAPLEKRAQGLAFPKPPMPMKPAKMKEIKLGKTGKFGKWSDNEEDRLPWPKPESRSHSAISGFSEDEASDVEKTKEETKKTFPNVKHFTKQGHPDWAKHGFSEAEKSRVIHYQPQAGHPGSNRLTLPHCGAGWTSDNHPTNDKSKVTCKSCLRKLAGKGMK